MDNNALTIEQLKELKELFTECPASGNIRTGDTRGLDNFAVGELVVVRTYSAGVWCGVLDQKARDEVVLKNARRMWSWWCKESISLSGVVRYGIVQDKSKIAAPVDLVWLVAIEIMPINGAAAKSIMEAPIVQAD